MSNICSIKKAKVLTDGIITEGDEFVPVSFRIFQKKYFFA
jgi:hypothetical protein